MNAGMNVLFVRLARFGTVLALAVVMLGAWVRLHDAGLGCPDWPGCYGKLVVPDSATAAQDPGFAARPLVAAKAWREMIHRYLAGTLVLVVVALNVLAWRNRKDPSQPWRRPLALLGLIVFQALLGMWTVTLLLKPLIVVAHLFGGLATLALLASLGDWRHTSRPAAPDRRRPRAPRAPARVARGSRSKADRRPSFLHRSRTTGIDRPRRLGACRATPAARRAGGPRAHGSPAGAAANRDRPGRSR